MTDQEQHQPSREWVCTTGAAELLQTPPLAFGQTAAIFAWHTGCVLKLYRPDYPLSHIELEAKRAQIAHAVGIRTPAVLDMIEIEGRHGLIFERIDGPTLVQAMLAAPDEVNELARQFAVLHASIHQQASDLDILQMQRLTRQITAAPALDPVIKDMLLTRLSAQSTRRQLCHGDFHPNNVLMSDDGLVVIDWLDMNVGDPGADVVRTVLLLTKTTLSADLSPADRQLLETLRTVFCSAYLEHYALIQVLRPSTILDWQQIVAAARLSEGISDVQELETLLGLAHGHLTLAM